MKILFLTSRPPYPPNRGDKVRTNLFLNIIAKEHKVFLFSFIEKEIEKEYYHNLKPLCEKVFFIKQQKIISFVKLFLGLFNILPFQVNYYYSKKNCNKIEEIVKKNNIDCAYTHLIRMAPFSKDLNCFKILDYTDAISMEYKRSLPFRKNLLKKIFYSIEASRTIKFEKKIVDYFDVSWFISKDDISFLNFSRNSKVKIVTNPVKISKQKSDFIKKNVIIFVGNLSVPHNINAVEFIFNKVMPNLITKDNNIKFHVVGADPVKIIQDMNGRRNTKIIGFVEDLYGELIDSDIFVAPMFFSAGIQNKVLEAMSVGLPVITTQNVASSLDCKHKIELLVAENAEDFIRMINNLLDDKELRENIGRNCHNFIKQNFSMEIVERKIQNSLNYLLENNK